MKKIFSLAALVILGLALTNCSSSNSAATSAAEDSSASGTEASAVGGSLNSSTSGGTVSMMREGPAEKNSIFQNLFLQKTYAGNVCPTILSNTNGTNCAANGSAIDLTYNSCSFGTSAATWSGILAVTPSSGSFACGGTLPSYANNTITRQFVNGSNVPSSVTRTSAYGTTVTINNAASLTDYASDTSQFHAVTGGGYGSQITHDASGKVTNITVTEGVVSTLLNHTVTGSLSVAETTVSGVKTWTIASGTMYVYHNLLHITGTSTFTNVVYNTTCCTPVSGSISTSFSNGSSESLTFNSCGSATLASGTASATVTLSSCY